MVNNFFKFCLIIWPQYNETYRTLDLSKVVLETFFSSSLIMNKANISKARAVVKTKRQKVKMQIDLKLLETT